ncbi:MAG: GntR family transcriptional regulator [Peptococcaceae bacterium]|nr:GntR family transcriptional regulator [Peptococcaceae bacterium]
MLVFDAKRPIYMQLMDDMETKIASGQLKPGAKIESVRDMAVLYGVNPNTVQRALSELERSGLLNAQRTNGRFVTLDQEQIRDLREKMAAEKINNLIKHLESLGFNHKEILNLIEKKLKEMNES